ncbi:MAG: acyltransferase family protein, partial [Christensenellaceae bacterium]
MDRIIPVPRKSNLELLRIFSMILIVTSHYVAHGTTDIVNAAFSGQKILAQCMALGNFGTWLFLLISGYFLVNASFSFKKLIKLMLEVFTYSIAFLLIQIGFGGLSSVSIKEIIFSVMPVAYGQYWFISAYVLMYLFLPFLNVLIKEMNQRLHLQLVGLIGLVWIILPTFIAASTFCFNMILPILIFFIAAYIKMYPNQYFASIKLNTIIAGGSFFLYCLSVVILNLLGQKINALCTRTLYFGTNYSLLVCLCAVGTFLVFENWNMKYNATINYISSSTLGVYLIHENVFVRDFVWKVLFNNAAYYNTTYFILHLVLSVAAVF